MTIEIPPAWTPHGSRTTATDELISRNHSRQPVRNRVAFAPERCRSGRDGYSSGQNMIDSYGRYHEPKHPRRLPGCVGLLVLAEDHRFRRHLGVDPWALCRAVWQTLFCNSPQGGSTIAMQLVRTILRSRQPTMIRKAKEIVLAVMLSNYADKAQLPTIYLWCAYYGWRMNNFVEACSRLRIDIATVSPIEEARLIARIKYPQPRAPKGTRMAQIQRRAFHVLRLSERNDARTRLLRRSW